MVGVVTAGDATAAAGALVLSPTKQHELEDSPEQKDYICICWVRLCYKFIFVRVGCMYK